MFAEVLQIAMSVSLVVNTGIAIRNLRDGGSKPNVEIRVEPPAQIVAAGSHSTVQAADKSAEFSTLSV